MVDSMSKNKRSQIMKSIKSTGTSIEEAFCKELWGRGIRYRRNVSGLFGKPDIAIKKYRLVVFVDSCFWHGCITHCRMPKTNQDYWMKKIERNIQRDQKVTEYYLKQGWKIIRIWEHQLKNEFDETVENVVDQLNEARRL